ncbi:GNAT family N-acetyltransferase [Paenibacillus sp. J5C_2022]|uniref:GNAT family N-acetyltransferase n=1 Tax=Paenibacillus sp. J5C2022 TaxID=2977129 RepID=UPI0021D0E084|nr:GNAT family N-acetyltransferase [Paenibacillus sp. J5C2022]MCU6709977.1 GNAT family N-acetyltransferase [Paenibacillus sp. J5C2022]
MQIEEVRSRVLLYDRNNLDSIDWPDTEDGRYARAYLEPLMREGTTRYIRNVDTTILLARIDDLILPITVNEGEYDNAYVCSPYTHYIRYARQELSLLQRPRLEKSLSAMLHVFGYGMKRSHLNRVVHINNWLLSTNLFPRITGEQVVAVLHAVREQFPCHAIVIRSLCSSLHPDILGALRTEGCKLVPSRQVYLYCANDADYGNAKARWLLKRDYELLARNGYTFVPMSDMTAADLSRIAELYKLLYLDKYSYDNPQFDETFISSAMQSGALTLYGLRKDGRLDAVMGYFSRNGVMTTPLFGYDTTLPQSVGLYRMLSACLIRQSREAGHLLHESAGAAQFKRNRGAIADFEYSAVYDRHLPLGRRWCWAMLERLLNGFGVPLMRKLKL